MEQHGGEPAHVQQPVVLSILQANQPTGNGSAHASAGMLATQNGKSGHGGDTRLAPIALTSVDALSRQLVSEIEVDRSFWKEKR
jgi:hypothetical protein